MVANITRSRIFTFKLLKMFFNLLKVPDPRYAVLEFGDNLSSRNRDVSQNVILQGHDLERSRSSMKKESSP